MNIQQRQYSVSDAARWDALETDTPLQHWQCRDTALATSVDNWTKSTGLCGIGCARTWLLSEWDDSRIMISESALQKQTKQTPTKCIYVFRLKLNEWINYIHCRLFCFKFISKSAGVRQNDEKDYYSWKLQLIQKHSWNKWNCQSIFLILFCTFSHILINVSFG